MLPCYTNDIVENPMVQAGGSSNSLWSDAATGTYTQNVPYAKTYDDWYLGRGR